MHRTYLLLPFLSLFCIDCNVLFAAPENEKSDGQNIFQQLDKNSDGSVTADEVPEDKKRFFDHLIRLGDQDKDGKLTQKEFEAGLNKEKDKFPAVTGPEQNRGRRDFQSFMTRMDRNGDKKFSKDEIPEPLRERFAPLFKRLDKEEISLEDLKQFGRTMRGKRDGDKNTKNPQRNMSEISDRMFQRLDSNQDGKLSLDEVPERGKRLIQRIYEQTGKEKGESISKKEFTEAFAKFRPQRRPDGQPGANNKQEMKRPGRRDSQMNRRRGDAAGNRPPTPAFFKTLDTNEDGKLSKDELIKVKDQFDKLDRNGDGLLDLREIMGRGSRDRNSGPIKKTDRKRPDVKKDNSTTDKKEA